MDTHSFITLQCVVYIHKHMHACTLTYPVQHSIDQQWLCDPSSIQFGESIGEGQFGDVFRGVLSTQVSIICTHYLLHPYCSLLLQNGEQPVAIKTCKPDSTEDQRHKFLQEAGMFVCLFVYLSQQSLAKSCTQICNRHTQLYMVYRCIDTCLVSNVIGGALYGQYGSHTKMVA